MVINAWRSNNYRVCIYSIFLSLVCGLNLPLVTADEVNSRNVSASIWKISPHSAQLSTGQIFSFKNIIWFGQSVEIERVVGMQVNIVSDKTEAAELKVSRYGGVQGRLVSLDGVWLQEKWVKSGSAMWAGRGNTSKITSRNLLAAEMDARISRRGVWQHKAVLDVSELKLSDADNTFQIIKGQVRNVRTIRGTTYLNFGNDWRDDFTAAISSRNRAKFRNQDWKLSELVNKWIRVRGKLRRYNGPYMDLIFPQQVELLDLTEG